MMIFQSLNAFLSSLRNHAVVRRTMLEPEHIKVASFFMAALWTKFGTQFLATAMPDDIVTKYIERGGSALCVALLIFAVRILWARLKEREERLDLMHEKEVQAHEKSAETRV